MVPSDILRNQSSHTAAFLYGDATIKGTIVQLTCNALQPTRSLSALTLSTKS